MDKSPLNNNTFLACVTFMMILTLHAEQSPDIYQANAAYPNKTVKFSDHSTQLNFPISHCSCIYQPPCFFKHQGKLVSNRVIPEPETTTMTIPASKHNNLTHCKITFTSQKTKDIRSIFDRIELFPMLAAAESDPLIESGGIIGITGINDSDILLTINLALGQNNGVEINGNLLEIANSVQ